MAGTESCVSTVSGTIRGDDDEISTCGDRISQLGDCAAAAATEPKEPNCGNKVSALLQGDVVVLAWPPTLEKLDEPHAVNEECVAAPGLVALNRKSMLGWWCDEAWSQEVLVVDAFPGDRRDNPCKCNAVASTRREVLVLPQWGGLPRLAVA